METDFLAAHRIDTDWFAVDRDGYVAVFESGEAGAMPFDAARAGGPRTDSMRRSVLTGRTSGWIYDADAYLEPETDEHCAPRCDNSEMCGPVLMFTESIEAFREELTRSGGKEVPANGSAAVLWQSIPVDAFRRFHADGTCLHCRYYYERSTWTRPTELLPHGHCHYPWWRDPDEEPDDYRGALFVYQHMRDNWISGPYGRTTLPVNPVHVRELSEITRERLERCRFEALSFRDEPLIQPVEHFECRAGAVAWLSCDGKSIHPMPGLEEHYLEFVSDANIRKHYRVDLPQNALNEEHANVQEDFRPEPPAASANGKLDGPTPSPHRGGRFWARIRNRFSGG